MLPTKKWIMRPLQSLQQKRWPPPIAVAPTLGDGPLEEEKTPYYDPKRFYPTRIGEVLNDRYQVATKLGYGTNSTVWLARDLSQWRWSAEVYVAVKIVATDRPGKITADHELKITELVSKSNPRHEGWYFVRTLLDSFKLKGPSSNHTCLVFNPLREPLWLLKTRFKGNAIPPELLKIMLQMLLHALDYLHSACGVIHADLKPDNVMVKLENKSILAEDARDEFNNLLPVKICNDRTIYLSRNNYGRPSSVTGIISITDFGHSIRGPGPHNGCIQAEPYRAPEVILDAGYTYSSDIWNLGVMLWDLLEDKTLFEAADPLINEYDDGAHLAYITALLGPPPKELLNQGKRTSLFYNSEGKLDLPIETPEKFTLESSISKIEGEDKIMFLKFMRRMLTWKPEDRSTAKELLDDPWLYT